MRPLNEIKRLPFTDLSLLEIAQIQLNDVIGKVRAEYNRVKANPVLGKLGLYYHVGFMHGKIHALIQVIIEREYHNYAACDDLCMGYRNEINFYVNNS